MKTKWWVRNNNYNGIVFEKTHLYDIEIPQGTPVHFPGYGYGKVEHFQLDISKPDPEKLIIITFDHIFKSEKEYKLYMKKLGFKE